MFREMISLSVVVCYFIDNISLKHDPGIAASKCNASHIIIERRIPYVTLPW